MSKILLILILVFSIAIIPTVSAQSSVSIILEKTTYSYCEKLFYTIKVSEVTGDPAIIHIRDSEGKGSSAIPIAITGLENPVPSLVAFQPEIFPLGKYFIDIEYMGEKISAEFELIDSGKKCFPNTINIFVTEWYHGKMSDGFLIDAFQKQVDKELINIPFEVSENNIYKINIPNWVKDMAASWWLQGIISDEEFANIMNYLIKEKIISDKSELDNGI